MTTNSDQHDRNISLCTADALAVDAAMTQLQGAQGEDVDIATEAETKRVEQVRAVLGLLEHLPVAAPADDLVRRTLSGIHEATHSERFAQQIDMLRPATPRMMLSQFGRWLEMGVAAAMIVIGLSLMFPVLEHNRAYARRDHCVANLAGAGMGFARYAADHNGVLPRENATPNSPWNRIGRPVRADGQLQSNSAQLFLLIRHDYVQAPTLTCPDNEHAISHLDSDSMDWPDSAAVSFSYQNQYIPQSIRVSDNPRRVIVADRNPMFIEKDGRVIQDINVSKDSPSRLHKQLRGQNLLWIDGSTIWQYSPNLPNGDNLWTAEGIERYDGNEAPTDPHDVHLIP